MSDEVRTTSSTGGEKGVKPARFDLLPPGPLWQVAELYGRGALKYSARNWERGYEWSKSYGAMQRHASLFWQGEDLDAETGKPHLAPVVFHALALMEFATTHPEFDDRPSVRRVELAPQYCGAVGNLGYACVEPARHNGRHIARGTDRTIAPYATWPQ